MTDILNSDRYQRILNDPARVRAVHEAIDIGESKNDALNRLTKLAARVLRSEVAVLSFIDDGRQLFRCLYRSIESDEIPLSIALDKSLCRYTLTGEVVAVDDLRRFNADFDSSVYHSLGLNSYLGAPLKVGDGHTVGTLCVVDKVPRKWSIADRETIQDIAECAMTEIQLQISLARIEHENQSREKIISMLAHDLRTPLNIIQNNAELVLSEESDTSLMKECTASILRSAYQANHLTNSFLDWKLSFLGPGDAIVKDVYDLVEICKNCLFDLSRIHGEIFKFEFNTKPMISEINEYAIRRSLENLLGNAIKYGEKGKTITLKLLKDEVGGVTIIVHNFGEPLLKDELENIFRPYYRSQSAKSNKMSKGWGLGLAVVHSVAMAHGGSVSVSSSHTDGTAFTFKLPAPKLH